MGAEYAPARAVAVKASGKFSPEVIITVFVVSELNIYEAYVNEHSIKNVIFTDFISDEQLRWMYENTAVYCFPSLSEGFGLPGLEAMLHGAPVASSTATCLPETHGDAAHYFDPYDVEDIAHAIDDLLTDEKLRRQLIKKGKQHVKTFSWQRMAEQTLAVYNSVVKD